MSLILWVVTQARTGMAREQTSPFRGLSHALEQKRGLRSEWRVLCAMFAPGLHALKFLWFVRKSYFMLREYWRDLSREVVSNRDSDSCQPQDISMFKSRGTVIEISENRRGNQNWNSARRTKTNIACHVALDQWPSTVNAAHFVNLYFLCTATSRANYNRERIFIAQ